MNDLLTWVMGAILVLLAVAALLTVVMLLVVIRGELRTSQTPGGSKGSDLTEREMQGE